MVAAGLVVLCLPSTPGKSALAAPQSAVAQARGAYGSSQDPFAPPLHEDDTLHERRIKLLNIERQKLLVRDAQRLLLLAKELHAQVGRQENTETGPATLESLQQIEKLAKSVREKMAEAAGDPGPVFVPPFSAREP